MKIQLNSCPPARKERKGMAVAGAIEWLSLLLVVHCCAGVLLALRIGACEGDRAALAVGGYDATTANRNFVALLVGERQRMIVDFLVGPRIRTRIPCDRVVFAVVLARPFAMQRLTVAIGAIYRNFHAVSSGLVDNRGKLRRPRTDLGLGLVEFPGAHLWVVGEAHGCADKTQQQSK